MAHTGGKRQYEPAKPAGLVPEEQSRFWLLPVTFFPEQILWFLLLNL